MAAADDFLAHADQHAAENAVPDMASQPGHQVAVLTCMDTRIDTAKLLGVEPGQIHTLRNAGGIVTEDVIRSLSASQRLLGTTAVVVIMHEGCGLNGASEDDFAQTLADDGLLPSWRLGAFSDVDDAVRAGVAKLRNAPELPHRDSIRGLVFDPRTGGLRQVD